MKNLKTYESYIFEKDNQTNDITDVQEFEDYTDIFIELRRQYNVGHYRPFPFNIEECKTITLFTGNAIYMDTKKSEFSYTSYDDSGFRIFRSDDSKKKFRVVKYKIENDYFYTINLTQKREPTRYFKGSTLKSCLYKIKELEKE